MEKNSLFRHLKALFTEPNEPRRYYKDREVKQLHVKTPENFQPIYHKNRAMWQSSAGFFRLWQGEDGARALAFAFHPDDLQMELKQGRLQPANSSQVYLAYGWEADEQVTLSDILRAADNFSTALHDAVMRVGILYETDSAKRLFRSGHVFYQLREVEVDGETMIDRIDFGTDLEDEMLANPYGRNIMERAIRRLEAPYREDLREMEARKRAGAGNSEDFGRLLTIQQAEAMMRAHFTRTLKETLRGRNPVAKEDQHFNRRYYAVMNSIQNIQAFLLNNKKKRLPLTRSDVREARDTIENGTALLAAFLEHAWRWSVLFAGIALAFKTYSFARHFIKEHGAERRREDKFTVPSGFKGTFGNVLRLVNPETFVRGSFINGLSFDAFPPIGVNVAGTPELELEASLNAAFLATPGVVERYHEKKDAAPSTEPARNVAAVERWLKNGLREIRFLDDGRIWRSFNPADHVEGVLPAQPILDMMVDGSVIETIPSSEPGAAPVTHVIPAHEAAIRFAEKIRSAYPAGLPSTAATFVRPSGTESILSVATRAADEILEAEKPARKRPRLKLVAENENPEIRRPAEAGYPPLPFMPMVPLPHRLDHPGPGAMAG